MFGHPKYSDALKNAAHYLALGQDTIYIDADDDAPWTEATSVEPNGGYRFNGPVGMNIVANVAGLTFKWSVDFEHRDANGRGVSLFNRDRLRATAMRLPPVARRAFAEFFTEKVMPDLTKRTAEIREALNKQADSEDCVRGLIAFASDPARAAA